MVIHRCRSKIVKIRSNQLGMEHTHFEWHKQESGPGVWIKVVRDQPSKPYIGISYSIEEVINRGCGRLTVFK